jgi:hypothetical protein
MGVLAAAGGRSRRAVVAGSALVLAGAACTRWSIFRAGFQSAADPRYTVGPQRDRARAQGSHASTATGGRRSVSARGAGEPGSDPERNA